MEKKVGIECFGIHYLDLKKMEAKLPLGATIITILAKRGVEEDETAEEESTEEEETAEEESSN